MKALTSSLISECVFVYDCHTSKSTGNWTNQRIQSLCKANTPKATQKQIVLSNPHLISGLKEEKVDHPLFGVIGRVGWAKMKGGEEWAFRVTRKVKLT
jgi:hypothetical protein